jgi:hypothetical protein
LVEPQNQGGGGFLDLGLKIIAMVFLVWASNQIDFGLSVAL